MKFVPGDDTDRALCATISHEYLRCDDSLPEFARFRQEMMIAVHQHERSAGLC